MALFEQYGVNPYDVIGRRTPGRPLGTPDGMGMTAPRAKIMNPVLSGMQFAGGGIMPTGGGRETYPERMPEWGGGEARVAGTAMRPILGQPMGGGMIGLPNPLQYGASGGAMGNAPAPMEGRVRGRRAIRPQQPPYVSNIMEKYGMFGGREAY